MAERITNIPKVLFLFNHDAAHQAAHIAGIMATLAEYRRDWRIEAAVGTPDIERQVRALVPADQQTKIEWRSLDLSGTLDAALTPFNSLAPVKRLARLRRSISLFESADLVVSPERTCLAIKRLLIIKHRSSPPFVFVPHGAGDRSVTYHPDLAGFDYFLVSGRKVKDEFVAHGIAQADQCFITGYAKFDTASPKSSNKLFENDRPTVVYNPHFDPALSSWYDHGPDILRLAAQIPDGLNIIFAPHVMLFRKKLHVSLEHRAVRLRPEIPQAAIDAPNILIDTDSPSLFDMTYTSAADFYLGDVSSQIYEFLRTPKPSVFIDANGHGKEAYQFWQNGPVVNSGVEALTKLIDANEWSTTFVAKQKALFEYTMDIDPKHSASERGARALEEILAAEILVDA
ncbi:hypothetical protein E3U23_03590 [Erythrobacter litoralis]|uniref:hypothetical protein n=1 Tax=Erythrobacter litoralis TaxID=39960 RepID=UPI002435759B|nr:hypothetical protein [Erythrobacter litoralis]MDG6078271.1 hypothetical protein [Erythrobacter litoralis]